MPSMIASGVPPAAKIPDSVCSLDCSFHQLVENPDEETLAYRAPESGHWSRRRADGSASVEKAGWSVAGANDQEVGVRAAA